MTGWLPKEILDHLEHAGYVAVPKERVQVVEAFEDVGFSELCARSTEHRFQIDLHIAKRLAHTLGLELLRRELVSVKLSELGGRLCARHSVTLCALSPRVIPDQIKEHKG